MAVERTTRYSTRPGFTLIELIIVATMIGVVAAIAVPKIVPHRTAPEQGAQVLTTTLMMAQRMAVTEQRNVIVRFDMPAAEVVVHLDSNQNEEVDPDERVSRIPLGEGVQIGSAAPARDGETATVTFTDRIADMPAVTFRRNGSASEAGAVYLTWRRAEPADSRMVVLTRSTGRAEVYRYTGTGWAPERRSR